MRIERKQDSRNPVSTGRLINTKKVDPAQGKEFPDVLDKQHALWSKADLDELLNKLDDIGSRLLESFSIYDLRNYKETLKNFLHETVGKGYKLKEEKAWTRRGKLKIYQCLEQIDTELEELSKTVLNKQKNQLKMIEKLDSIRGLLVDLYS